MVQAHKKLMTRKRGELPSYKDVLSTLHDFGFDLTEREGLQLIEQLDLDKSGSIDLHEWLAALMNWSKVGPPCLLILSSFGFDVQLDLDNSSSIDLLAWLVAPMNGSKVGPPLSCHHDDNHCRHYYHWE